MLYFINSSIHNQPQPDATLHVVLFSFLLRIFRGILGARQARAVKPAYRLDTILLSLLSDLLALMKEEPNSHNEQSNEC